MIVEVHDHRDQAPEEYSSERIVLWPNDEALYAEICLVGAKNPDKWSDLDALTFEANHLVCSSSCVYANDELILSCMTVGEKRARADS